MPRISPTAFKTARARHPHLAKLLPVCKDLRSAENELRWIRERAQSDARDVTPHNIAASVSQLVHRRSRGEPLQYILGSEFFGDLELKCKPGILIPRLETAASVSQLVKLLTARLKTRPLPSRLRVLDFCTGTGCIPLLFHDDFYKDRGIKDLYLDITGYDISNDALALAHENLAIQKKQPANCSAQGAESSVRRQSLHNVTFLRYDVLKPDVRTSEAGETSVGEQGDVPLSNGLSAKLTGHLLPAQCDVLISNPPYISPSDYMRTAARSVRHFEPKLALVPPSLEHSALAEELGDRFYPLLLDLAEQLSAKVVLLEVADVEQAQRVVAMVANRQTWDVDVEIWRDEPSRDIAEETTINGRDVKIIGEGNGRSVVIWREDLDAF